MLDLRGFPRSYPLDWPPGQPRTTLEQMARARFKPRKFRAAKAELLAEARRWSANGVEPTISTMVQTKPSGTPLERSPRPEDPGAAVYFIREINGSPQLCAFACDRFDRVEDNLHALARTIDSLRKIERDGTKHLVTGLVKQTAVAIPSGSPP